MEISWKFSNTTVLWKFSIGDYSPSCINEKDLNLAINEERHASVLGIIEDPSSSVGLISEIKRSLCMVSIYVDLFI